MSIPCNRNEMIRNAARALCVAALILGFAGTASAQSAADPTGTPPIGIESKSVAKGPSLAGVLTVKLLNATAISASSGEMVIRLRRGSQLNTFFASLAGPLVFETEQQKADLQDDVLDAFREKVLGGFFADDCNRLGTGCEDVDIVLKKADEYGQTNDGINSWVVLDVVIATTEPL
jgi:hypothetical protein